MEEYFRSSESVFNWLSDFINLERGQKPKSFRIERMEVLAELADHPELCAPSIHIAGSKGKGSVTSMLSAMLTAAGFRVARYMSPHVTDIRERICLGDLYFSDDIYCSAGDELKNIVEERLPALVKTQSNAASLFSPTFADGCEPTFWELLTLLFFLCAKKAKCDVMVVETGMGGRLDSTNVLDPLVSVITLIELEHTSFLGSTIEAVATEKAGIIKKGKPLVLAKQCDEALNVFKESSREKNSPLIYFLQTANLSNIKITTQGTDFTLSFNTDKNIAHTSPLSLSIPIPGKVQAENASLAIAALKIAFPQIGEDAIRGGLKKLKIPARFEKMTGADTPPFIIDGAHTPESLALCVETFCLLYGEGGVLLFGCAADKNSAAMAEIACPHFAKIFITTPGTFKASDPDKVYETFAEIAGREKVALVKDTQEAVRQAVLFAKNSSRDGKILPVLGTGSFYLVAEIREVFFKSSH
ncbi:bifunctional folylpolyglutamate synthase/dihydrofolate synthase [Treponema sp. R8-4-B8]